MKSVIAITTGHDVAVPSLPNFLRVGKERHALDVAKVSDDDLQRIGETWTAALIEHAARRRSATTG